MRVLIFPQLRTDASTSILVNILKQSGCCRKGGEWRDVYYDTLYTGFFEDMEADLDEDQYLERLKRLG